MKVECPNCDWNREVPEKIKGRPAECPKCGKKIKIGVTQGSLPSDSDKKESKEQKKEPEKTKTSNGRGFGWVVLLLVAILLAVTNPDGEKHKAVIRSAEIEDHPFWGPLGKAHIVAETADYNNYVVFSTTTVRGKTATMGLLGQTWVIE